MVNGGHFSKRGARVSTLWYVNGGLAVALVALGAVAWHTSNAPTPDVATAGPAVELSPLPDLGPGFNPQPLTAFKDTLAKPVFSPTRTPAPHAGGAAEGTRASLRDLALQGIMVEGGRKTAMFWSAQKSETVTFVLGDKIGDWTVLEMTPKMVFLTRGTEHMKLPLTIEAALDAGKDGKTRRLASRRSTDDDQPNRSFTRRRSVDGAAIVMDADG